MQICLVPKDIDSIVVIDEPGESHWGGDGLLNPESTLGLPLLRA